MKGYRALHLGRLRLEFFKYDFSTYAFAREGRAFSLDVGRWQILGTWR